MLFIAVEKFPSKSVAARASAAGPLAVFAVLDNNHDDETVAAELRVGALLSQRSDNKFSTK